MRDCNSRLRPMHARGGALLTLSTAGDNGGSPSGSGSYQNRVQFQEGESKVVNSIVLSAMSWASSLKNAVGTRLREEAGQDLIEYAMLVGFIAVAAAAAFLVAGIPDALTTFAENVAECVSLNDPDACAF